MNKIDKQLKKIKTEERIGLMTHIVVGYPSISKSKELVRVMVGAGVDFIEMQIPFSDPIADGPTLMRANQKSLEKIHETDKKYHCISFFCCSIT